ncbi:hypothetical protein DES49_2963 [Halospina denitrificans]|uniref:Esterase n=1 Tax=Halospina denitrificans TaxID=332522 RepID=A0A4R7JGS7_9GAMM|nr:YqiA/YcfP family alpha/beta fold hydrolase [Halospina denitrificans]TDT37011.1 hypothetical protein DES49_2963 [Halospina denitrificans]
MVETAPDIIYLHGFRSSPQSDKAQALDSHLKAISYSGEWFIPELAYSPVEIEKQLDDLIQGRGDRAVGLIGSSLGGFFAYAMAERYGLPAVLINPAAYPYDLMNQYLGTQTNLYTGEAFEVTREDVECLRDLDPGEPSHPERLMVMLQTGDETLDYREAERRFANVHLMVEEGGDHRFSSFENHLSAMLTFLADEARVPDSTA